VTAPAYDHFLRRIGELETVGLKLKARQLSKDFPKYLQYERVKELVTSLDRLYLKLVPRVLSLSLAPGDGGREGEDPGNEVGCTLIF